MKPEDFLTQYESALHTQNWELVKVLIHNNAGITFTNGKVLLGISEIEIAYKKNFSYFKNEEYSIRNVRWLHKTNKSASYLFDFYWKCIIDGKLAEGEGIGTASLVKEDKNWLLISEHLGKRPT